MANCEFIFIDESGDPGSGEGDSSNYYATLAFQVSDEIIPSIVRHINNWRYVRNYNREMKYLGKKADVENFLLPLLDLKSQSLVSCSAVYLFKENYTGPYLKPMSPRGENPIYFRNFVHRKLLAHHFLKYPPLTANLEVIFDRFEMSNEAVLNLSEYLQNSSELPQFKHITHADSRYTDFLQIASVLVNCIKDVIMVHPIDENHSLCKFVHRLDITSISK